MMRQNVLTAVISMMAAGSLVGVSSPALGSDKTVAQAATASGGRECWTNSLGMVFAPVPGARVLFSIWDTRVQDYQIYAETNKGVNNAWRSVSYQGVTVSDGPTHPVTMVSWDDAQAFCKWLTQRERASGLLSDNQSYRLPTDAEWSQAAGLSERASGTPMEKSTRAVMACQLPGGIEAHPEDLFLDLMGKPAPKRGPSTKPKIAFPWGTDWPPPAGAGNYADQTARKRLGKLACIEGFDDGSVTTAPVGTFHPNQFGLYDMGGNVWQWCEDMYDTNPYFGKNRVYRGASWREADPGEIYTAYRNANGQGARDSHVGFRCVLVRSAPR